MSNFFTKPDAYMALGMPRRIRVSTLKLPTTAHMAGLRAVFLADIHLRKTNSNAWLEALVGQIVAAKPDILLLGGDYGESAEQQQRFFQALGQMEPPPLGAYAVLGNNDRECFEDPGALRALMARNGVLLLVNETRTPPALAGKVAIGGLDEQKYGVPRVRRLFQDCAADAYRILLTHQPHWPQARVDLILAGHTHGGQLNFAGLTPFSVGYEKNRYPTVKGTSLRADGALLLVSRGIGYSRLPVRLGAYPELHLVDFTK